jgi:hypothetical protein
MNADPSDVRRILCTFPDIEKYSNLCAPNGAPGLENSVEHRVAVRAFEPPTLRRTGENSEAYEKLDRQVAETVRILKCDEKEAAEHRVYSERVRNKSEKRDDLFLASEKEIAKSTRVQDTTRSFLGSMFSLSQGSGTRIHSILKDRCAKRVEIYRSLHNDDVSLRHAHSRLVGCLAIANISNNMVNGDDDSIKYGARLVLQYMEDNGAPFSWRSSASFLGGPSRPVFDTYVPREHAVMLAWRAAMVAMKYAMSIYDPTDDLRSIFELEPEEEAERRRTSVYLILYALNLLSQVIPSQMRALHGSLGTQNLSNSAAAMPEFRQSVLDSMVKLAHSILEQIVLRQFNIQTLRDDADLNWLSTSQRYERYTGQEGAIEGERNLCSKLCAFALDGAACEAMNSMRCLVFIQNFEALSGFTLNAWAGRLDETLRDFRVDNDYESRMMRPKRIYASETHKAVYSWIRSSVDTCPDEIYKENAGKTDPNLAALYNAADPARALRNLISGTAIYQECMLMARELQIMDIDDPAAVNRASVLAQKLEILFSPLYGRRRAALELSAWVVSDMRDRCDFCSEACDRLIEDSRAYERGKYISSVKTFTQTTIQRQINHRMLVNALHSDDVDTSVESTKLQDPYDTISMSSVSGDGVGASEVVSTAASVLMRQLARKIYGSSEESRETDEEKDDGNDAQRMLATMCASKTQRIIPLNDDDISLWISIVGAYDTRKFGSQNLPQHQNGILEGSLHAFTQVAPRKWIPAGISDLYSTISNNFASDVVTVAEPYYILAENHMREPNNND